MYPYGGYDPFSTPSSKFFAQTPTMPDRPPFAQAPAPASFPFQQPVPYGFSHGFMPYMPIMPPGGMPPQMMPGMGMPFMQKGNNQNNQQGSGLTFGKAMGGANQLMGLAQQMGSIISLFK